MRAPRNILVVRNDKVGDFMLVWPAFALIKLQYPECRVTALVPEYTRQLAEICPWIDAVISDTPDTSVLSGARHLAREIKKRDFDASISFFLEFRTALALWFAEIPVRIAPATKLAQLLVNRKLVQRRSRSLKPEFQYNIELVAHMARTYGHTPVDPPGPPYLAFDNDEVSTIRNDYQQKHHLDRNHRLVIIHPGHGGSANNLSIAQYAELAGSLGRSPVHIIITAGPGEVDIAMQLSGLLGDISHSVYHSRTGLADFARFIAATDMFISGSTGPLHIAGALDIATCAFYPSRKSATSLRWQTLNQDYHRLAFSPENHSDDMSKVNLADAAVKILKVISTNP